MMTFADTLSKRIAEYRDRYGQMPILKMYYFTYRRLRRQHPNWFRDSEHRIKFKPYSIQNQYPYVTIVKTYLDIYEIQMIDDRVIDVDLENNDIGVVLI